MNYIPQLYDFLRRLSDNNNRPWFQAHKEEFDSLRRLWYADLERFIAAVARWWPEVAGQTPQTAAYRIYRDTRFSPDKTPYKTYFSAALCPQGKSAERPGLYIHQGPATDRALIPAGIYGGLWNPSAPLLKKLRHAIVDNIEEWESIVKPLETIYPGWCGDTLKRAPAGWPIDHPQIQYLKLKEYCKFRPLDERFFANPRWPDHTAEMMRPLKPLIDFINYTIDE